MKVGLVLSGGGAKGAYQAGVLKSMASAGIQIEAISGASIGALNGAIIAAAPDTRTAAERLSEVWKHVASSSPLEIDPTIFPRYLALLSAAGLSGVGRLAMSLLIAVGDKFAADRFDYGGAILKDAPLSDLLERFLCPKRLAEGIPLYVSLYKNKQSMNLFKDLVQGEMLKRFDTTESVFKHVQALPETERLQAVLASAAIPVLFRPKKVEGELYSDGGQGNYRKVQGNTPITPLLGKGLDLIIVTHLNDGSFWDVDDFPNEQILEIRPDQRISKKGAADMLGFDETRILEWIAQGESDATRVLDSLQNLSRSRSELRRATEGLLEEITRPDDDRLARLLAQLKAGR